MTKHLSKTLFILLFFNAKAFSQILPVPGAELNYTQVMLEYEKVKGATVYTIQVAGDSGANAFTHLITEQKDSSTATLICHLQFGKKYVWRYAGLVKGHLSKWKGPYNFSIMDDPYQTMYRVRVIKNDSSKNMQGLLCVDGVRSIVDREGKPVLFVPEVDAGYRKGAAVDDLRLTKYGTLCSIGGQNAIETDLRGDILWATPIRSKIKAFATFGDFYNHDFVRMNNGHYMVIGSNYVWKKIPNGYGIATLLKDSVEDRGAPVQAGVIKLKGGYLVHINENDTTVLMNMGWLCEYDKNDSLVWQWKPDAYLDDVDLFPKGRKLRMPINWQEPHINAFSVDAKNEFVYVSFRNLSRVVKVEKRTTNVVNSWGDQLPSGEARSGHDFFHYQHGVNILNDGTIALFNNGDTAIKTGFSKVVNFSQPSATDKEGKILWEYECNFDSSNVWKSARGGNVDELNNHNYLVCMGAITRVFEITKSKEIVWNAIAEQNAGDGHGWVQKPIYRAHYTSSLYTCYFTAQCNIDTLSRLSPAFKLKIYNEGTDGDSYSISVTTASKSFGEKNQSVIVEGGKSVTFGFAPLKNSVKAEKVEVVIMSNTNPDLKRKISLQWVVK